MSTLAERFEAKVNRSGEHHRWTGSKKNDGTGKLKVAGATMTAPRVAWELAHGALPPGMKVRGCPDEPACVRIEHLSLRPGNGSKRARWQLAVSVGRYANGLQRRL